MDKKDMPGDKLYADLIRAQTRDYNQRFAPIENFMAGQITATGTKSLGADLDRTRSNMGSAVTNVQGQQNRDMGRMGLQGNSNVANSTTAVGGLVCGLTIQDCVTLIVANRCCQEVCRESRLKQGVQVNDNDCGRARLTRHCQ